MLTALLALALAAPAHATAVRDGALVQLRPVQATATSFLQNDWNRFTENYHPNYVLDDDPKTAWVEGVDGTGEGEALTLPVSPVKGATQVRLNVRNGYQKSEALLRANAAPKGVTVSLLRNGQAVHTQSATLTREAGWQSVDLRPPKALAFDAVELRIDSVSPGSKYKDTCVSDVQVYVQAATAWSEAVEAGKYTRVTAWAAQRRADAKAFANQPAQALWAGTQFQHIPGDYDGPPSADQQARLTHLQPLRTALESQSGWHRLTHKRAVRPLPEGVWILKHLAGIVDPTDRSFLEVKDAAGPSTYQGDPDMPGSLERHFSNHKLQRDAQGAVTAVHFTIREVGHERGTWTTNHAWTVRFDDQGRLAEALRTAQGDDEMGAWEAAQHLRFDLDEQGRIAGVETIMREEWTSDWARSEPNLENPRWSRTELRLR